MKITLTEKWHSKILGVTFPEGTIFLWKRSDVWTYLCPSESYGECRIKGEVPGKNETS